MSHALAAIGVIGAGLLAGGMVFFAAIVSPLIFARLDPPTAALFVRATFPRYYAYMIVTALLGALGFLLAEQPLQAMVLAVVAVSTLWVRDFLLPKMNGLRDRQLSGDVYAGDAFRWMHRASVAVNIVQLVMVLAVIWSAALPIIIVAQS